MTDKGILIKNIYYMLTYAFQSLRQSNYEKIAAEEFENIHDLFAAILGKGVAQQLKQGLYLEYIGQEDDRTALRGKLDISGTIRNKMQRKMLLACKFEEMSEDNLPNRIVKTTMLLLVRQRDVKPEHKAVLKKNLLFFGGTSCIDPAAIVWNRIYYGRSHQNYRMLLQVCRFVLEGLLMSDEPGNIRMAAFLDDQRMSRLYEKFILEYYRYHHPELHANPDRIPWNLDDANDLWLPKMISDISLKDGERTLIVDAKYYGRQMQSQFDSVTLRNANLYQIFTYVKNRDVGVTGNVAGMLLYARTGEAVQPTNAYSMGGNRIFVENLDLNRPFSEMANQLEQIVVNYFGTGQSREEKEHDRKY
jgi:5-methylcytosine-specific restriction enzyme subunit McrC